MMRVRGAPDFCHLIKVRLIPDSRQSLRPVKGRPFLHGLKLPPMKFFLLAIILAHAILHALGFIKAYGLARTPKFFKPVTRKFGIGWLAVCFLLIASGALLFAELEWWWTVSFAGLLISEYLIVREWNNVIPATMINLAFFILTGIGYILLDLGITK